MATYYKYLSMGEDYMPRRERTESILREQRLFMAPYHSFNDPMEAFYVSNDFTRQKINDIKYEKRLFRLCCLSKCYNNILMWAHYADSHKGICIEVEVKPYQNCIQRNIQYVSRLEQPQGRTDSELCIDILRKKFLPWQYEQEVRFFKEIPIGLYTSPTCLDVEIKKVYLGCKLNDSEETKYREIINNARRGLPPIAIQKIHLSDLTWWKNKSNPQVLILPNHGLL